MLSNATMTYAKQVLAEAKRAQENEEEKGRAGKRSASYDAEKKLRSRRRVPLRAPRMRGCLTSELPPRRDDGSEGSTISSAFFEDVDLNEWIGVRIFDARRAPAPLTLRPVPRAFVQELDAAAASYRRFGEATACAARFAICCKRPRCFASNSSSDATSKSAGFTSSSITLFARSARRECSWRRSTPDGSASWRRLRSRRGGSSTAAEIARARVRRGFAGCL